MQVRFLSLLCLGVSVSVASTDSLRPLYKLEKATEYFEDFIIKYDKQYFNEQEKAERLEIFKANLGHINRLNKESDHAVFDVREFADLTTEEFSDTYMGLQSSGYGALCKLVGDKDIHGHDAPKSFDWRLFNAVTRVKNQGLCGSCWAFSTTGHLEGQVAIKHKRLLELSEQEFINCDSISKACCGGSVPQALKAAIKIGGVLLEKDCIYQEKQMLCKIDHSKLVVNVTNCYSYDLTSQERAKQLLFNVGPISIAIKGLAVQHYTAGIISDKLCQEGPVNHAVLLVGYGIENNVPFWIVKNSWGPDRGEGGYFRMQRGNGKNGACGMLNNHMSTADIV